MQNITNEEIASMMALRREMNADQIQQINLHALDAATLGYRRELVAHLRKGADANCLDDLGNPILFCVSQPGCALALLEWRADPMLANAKGILPLIHHIKMGHMKVAEIIADNMPRSTLATMRDAALIAGRRLPTPDFDQTKRWVSKTFNSLNAG